MQEKTLTNDEYIKIADDAQRQGKLEEAEKIYFHVLTQDPDHIYGLIGSANLALRLGKDQAAESLLAKAFYVDEKNADVCFFIGELKNKQKKYQEAINSYQNAINADESYELAYFRIGEIARELYKNAEAEIYFKKSLQLNPDCSQTLNNLSMVLTALGKNDEAIICINRLAEKHPDNADTLCNRGLILDRLGKDLEAIESIKAALKINPEHEIALLNLAMIYQRRKMINDAIPCYDKLLKINSDNEKALSLLLHCKRIACSWDGISDVERKVAELVDKQIKNGEIPSETCFENLVRTHDQQKNLEVAKAHCQGLPEKRFSFISRKKKDKINIGYISGDFRNHALSHLTQNMFKLHDRNKFNVFTYSYGPDDKSVFRANIESYSDKFTDISSVDFKEAASMIYSDEVDILIDLTGHTGQNRMAILAQKPAPVQISYLGFVGSSGADFIDYIIADKTVIPKEDQKYYSEEVLYLPDCYQLNSYEEIEDQAISKSDVGLPEDKFIFCSFNQSMKINEKIFDSWMKILKSVPDSVLWITRDNDIAAENLKKEASKRGIDENRLVFVKHVQRDEYLKRLKLADMSLDTIAYNGGTITADCLWSDVPVVTLYGENFASRMASSLLKNIGLSELVTNSLDEYEQIAIAYANDNDAYQRLKKKLQKNKSSYPLFDTKKTVKAIENVYKKVIA